MIAQLYANMCEAELWNQARLAAYMANGVAPAGVRLLCDPCEGLEEIVPCLDDAPPQHDSPLAEGYQLPELDPAPWYDPEVPESADFAGLLVLETSLSPAIDRRMVQNIGHGATMTRARFSGRTMYVRGLLVGRTCCAADYGLRWLTQALLGSYCGGCDGCLLTFLTCTPSDMTQPECLTVVEESGARVPYFREDESGGEWTRGLDFVRQMYGAGLLQGPEILGFHGGAKRGGCSCRCGAMTEVEFTVGLGNPWLYRLEDLVIEDQLLGGCETEVCRLTFSDDPDCDDPPTPPPSGRMPLQQCGCLPFVTGRNCFSVPAGADWFDQSLIIEVNAGSAPLRNFAVRLWNNPLGIDCCDPANLGYFEDCNSCGTLLVGYVPEGGLLRFDSAAREVTITCAGVTRPAAKNIATLEGLPFAWLEVGCQQACLGVDIDCLHTAEDATISVWRAGREL
jgi:hypothetical protein